jgi:hypothetical protein
MLLAYEMLRVYLDVTPPFEGKMYVKEKCMPVAARTHSKPVRAAPNEGQKDPLRSLFIHLNDQRRTPLSAQSFKPSQTQWIITR